MMVLEITLFVCAIALMAVFYSVFCYAPSENVDRCISCGEIIPEGRWVCPNCERKAKGKKDGKNS